MKYSRRNRTPETKLSDVLVSSVLCLSLVAGFYYALSSSLTQMTVTDWQVGILKACEQLERDGIKLPSMD